jgi:hypothetical protein
MKLQVFTEETRQTWIGSGFTHIKMTDAAHLSINDPEVDGIRLLEPSGPGTPGDLVTDNDAVVGIQAREVDEVIAAGTGRHYQ